MAASNLAFYMKAVAWLCLLCSLASTANAATCTKQSGTVTIIPSVLAQMPDEQKNDPSLSCTKGIELAVAEDCSASFASIVKNPEFCSEFAANGTYDETSEECCH